MSSRKKSTTSSESSSGSSTDSSSSSDSSSGSDSGSSSSDSESSSSQEQSRNSGSGSGSNNEKETKNNANAKVLRRRSSEAATTKTQNKTEDKTISNNVSTVKAKERVTTASTAKVAQQKVSKNSVYSSDDDSPPTKALPKKISNHGSEANKRKTSVSGKVKPVTSANITASVGGKAPPSVLKQHQQSGSIGKVPTNNKIVTNSKIASSVTKPISTIEKHNAVASKLKKKSIFSPDNSSETEDESPTKVSRVGAKTKQPVKTTTVKVGVKDGPKQAASTNNKSIKKVINEKNNKSSAESSVTTTSSDASSLSDSDSDSSEDSSPPAKKLALKKTVSKPNSSGKSNDGSKNNMDTDSEVENTKPATSVVRKLTRSSSTRKSKHLTGKAASETDSDVESVKRSVSKSPVKKAPIIATKGKTKNTTTKRNDTKNVANNATPTLVEERKCPIEGCDSMGHLGGQCEKHFTVEACPMFHNMAINATKLNYLERKKREDERKKAIALLDTSKKITTNEQKVYLQKVKELRAKFKPTTTSNTTNVSASSIDKDREPNMNGFVSEYDLQLFKDAQAIAAENMENELKALPASKGTKYISMGKYKMDVWYQSPYPEDAARLPKLYLCEFCLRYQKSEVGMKRHAAKCVWRHPPGDEIYRKGKLGVWQVDGKRHKQYCQHLCLLAKFFLDYKTLYYDVEPFLFYVMTLADSEGCHTVGYFSKEKNSFLNYNVSCILTLPPYQRKGYGRLLIDFSYLLTRVEGKIGSPEKPLSDLGLISYRSYWKDVLLDYLCSRTGTTLSIKDVSQEMAINSYDIVSTLQALGMMKYWKGKHIILKKQDVLDEYTERVNRRGNVLKIDPSCLRWTPFVPPALTGPSS